MAAAPTADVVLVAHEGLEDLSSVGDLWRGLPMDDVVEARWWLVPSAELPRSLDIDAQVDWLFAWWARLDGWIAERRAAAGHDLGREAWGSDVAAERVAGAWVAGLVAGGEPPLPLLGRAVRPRLRVDPAL